MHNNTNGNAERLAYAQYVAAQCIARTRRMPPRMSTSFVCASTLVSARRVRVWRFEAAQHPPPPNRLTGRRQ